MCGYMQPYPNMKILRSPQDCDSDSLLHLPAKQEPAQKMGYHRRCTVNESSDNSLTTRRAALQPWSQRQPKAFILHSSRSLEIVRYECKRVYLRHFCLKHCLCSSAKQAALVHSLFILRYLCQFI